MPGSMDCTECVVPCRKGRAVGNFYVGHRNTRAAGGIYRDCQPCFEGKRSANVIWMSMGDENMANAAALCTLLYNGIQVGGIINCWINGDGALDAPAKHNSICAWSRHHGGIWR